MFLGLPRAGPCRSATNEERLRRANEVSVEGREDEVHVEVVEVTPAENRSTSGNEGKKQACKGGAAITWSSVSAPK